MFCFDMKRKDKGSINVPNEMIHLCAHIRWVLVAIIRP